MGCLKLTYSDYQPQLKVVKGNFLTEKKSCAEAYRYGMQGQEKVDEIYGSGNAYDFGARMYDPRLGRWLSTDPLASEFPWQSPYCAFDNNPINKIDPDGRAATDPPTQDKVLKGEGASAVAKRNDLSLDQLAQYNPDVFKNYGQYEDKSEYWKNADKNYMLHPDQMLNTSDPTAGQYSSPETDFTFDLGFSTPTFGTTSTPTGVSGLGLTTFGLGTAGSIGEYTPGSFRLSTTKQGFSPKYYGNAWRGNQYTSTFNISRIGKGFSRIGFGLGLVTDATGVYNYYNNPTSSHVTHPGKAALNTGMGLVGLFGGPLGAFISGGYFLGELIHPEGWSGLLRDGAEVQKEYDDIWRSSGQYPNPFYRPRLAPWGVK